MRSTPLLIAATLLLAGCSAPGPSARCEAVSMERAKAILGSADGVYPVKAGAVKSTEHKNAYYVAILIGGPGMDKDTVGVWASAHSIEDGPVVAVDAIAAGFSDLPQDKENFSTTDKGADEARTCVR